MLCSYENVDMSSSKPRTGRMISAGEVMSDRLVTTNLLNSAKEAAIKMADQNVRVPLWC
jgi:hypothetical protein